MNQITKASIAVILLAALAAGTCGLVRAYLPYRTQKQELYEQECEKAAASWQELSYPGKSIGETSLSHYNKSEITDLLRHAATPYQERTATLKIGKDTLTYSMQDLGQRIFYQCSNRKTFEAGEEEELAAYLVSLDKELTAKEQYAIIRGEREATPIHISIECECDEKALAKGMKKLSRTYQAPVQNSRIDKSSTIRPARAGRALDTEEIARGLRTYLNRETTHHYSASYQTERVEPEWHSQDLKKVNTLIARYTTNYNNATPRGGNIHLAASRLNSTCLLPGEKISFLDVLYDDIDGKSYRKSSAYFKGRVVQAEGGGICQVSTTAYHTFLLAGIIPETRYPHSVPVGYARLGLDAALSVGGKDLVIENTLEVPILILSQAKNGTLAVAIQSYQNALNGYTYKPRTRQISSLEAKAFLDVYRGKTRVKTISLSHDVYQKKAN